MSHPIQYHPRPCPECGGLRALTYLHVGEHPLSLRAPGYSWRAPRNKLDAPLHHAAACTVCGHTTFYAAGTHYLAPGAID